LEKGSGLNSVVPIPGRPCPSSVLLVMVSLRKMLLLLLQDVFQFQFLFLIIQKAFKIRQFRYLENN
jgi:hypothetical protein